jgi:hypothetical protein
MLVAISVTLVLVVILIHIAFDAASRKRPPLSLVHFMKTGGTALGMWIDEHNIQIEHNSLPGSHSDPQQRRSNRKKHQRTGFDHVDVVTIVRNPLAMLVSRVAFIHSGTEFSHRPHIQGGINKPMTVKQLRDAVLYFQKLDRPSPLPDATGQVYALDAFLRHRASLGRRTHILCTEHLTEGAKKMSTRLRLGSFAPLKQQHVSQHASVADLFSSSEIEKFNMQFPTLYKEWKRAVARGGFAQDVAGSQNIA